MTSKIVAKFVFIIEHQLGHHLAYYIIGRNVVEIL